MEKRFLVQSFRQWEGDIVWCTDFVCATKKEALTEAENYARALVDRKMKLTEHGQSLYVRVVELHKSFNGAEEVK